MDISGYAWLRKLRTERKLSKNLNIVAYHFSLNFKRMEKKEPKIGDKIYIPSSYHVYRGEDDFEGGLAIINKIEHSKHLPKDHYNYTMVGIEGQPGTNYNWNYLLEEQEELEEEYKDKIAHANPDLRPEFNDNDADWR